MRMTFDLHSVRECVEKDESLAALRAEYARKSAEDRRMAADWEYHSSIAGRMLSFLVDEDDYENARDWSTTTILPYSFSSPPPHLLGPTVASRALN